METSALDWVVLGAGVLCLAVLAAMWLDSKDDGRREAT